MHGDRRLTAPPGVGRGTTASNLPTRCVMGAPLLWYAPLALPFDKFEQQLPGSTSSGDVEQRRHTGVRARAYPPLIQLGGASGGAPPSSAALDSAPPISAPARLVCGGASRIVGTRDDGPPIQESLRWFLNLFFFKTDPAPRTC